MGYDEADKQETNAYNISIEHTARTDERTAVVNRQRTSAEENRRGEDRDATMISHVASVEEERRISLRKLPPFTRINTNIDTETEVTWDRELRESFEGELREKR